MSATNSLPPPPSQTTPTPTPPPTIPPPSTIKSHRPPLPLTKLPTIHEPNPRQYRPKSTLKKRIPVTHKRPCFSFCCCFFMWLLILLFILAAAIAAATGVFWLLYQPQRPRFTIASLQLSKLDLTGNLATDALGHLSTSGNLTISAKNPNSRIATFYDTISMSTFSQRGVLIANSRFRSFESAPDNSTVLRFVFSNDRLLDLDAARSLRSDLLAGRSEMKGRVVLETKMGVQIGKWRSKRIGISILCQGLTVKVPKKKTATKRNGLAPSPAMAAAISDDGSCTVNLSIKFWGFVF